MDRSVLYMYIYRMLEIKGQNGSFPSLSLDYVELTDLNPWWETAEQIRPVWKLYWNDSDGAAVSWNGSYRILKGGSVYLIAPNTPYEAHYRFRVSHFYIHFRLPEPFGRIPPGIWESEPCVSRQNAEEAAKRKLWTFRDGLLFQEMVIHALRQLPEPLLQEERSSLLSGLFTWLDNHLDRDCRNSRLAEIASVSEDTLHRLFRKETGYSPQEYVRKLRISRAAVLLRRTDLTIDEIAEQTGFCDRAHFHRVFRDAAQETPAGFRRSSAGTS